MQLSRPLTLAVAISSIGAPATAQSFTPGDIFLLSQRVNAAADAGIMRIDSTTGAASQFLSLGGVTPERDTLAYDPYRDALLFAAHLGNVSNQASLYRADGDGTVTELVPQGWAMHAFAPTGDGRVYMHPSWNSEIEYLDATDTLHPVWNEDGTAPFEFTSGAPFVSFQYTAMVYHAPTNALFAAAEPWSETCDGGSAIGVVVKRAVLSPDGSRVVGPVACVEFDISMFSTGEVPVGFSVMDDGDLLLSADTNSNSAEPRMLRIDPYTMAATPFATSQHTSVAATTAGTWSSVLGKAVMLDTHLGVLRAYADGESGGGTIITPSVSISDPNAAGEYASMIEIGAAPCAGTVERYGDGVAGLGGYVPTLSITGCPTSGSTVSIHTAFVRGGAFGALLLGNAQASIPVLGGTLWLLPTVTVPLPASGPTDTAGTASTLLTVPVGPAEVPGTTFFFQSVFLDAAAPEGLSFSGGARVEFG